jgi:hypothetical protein
MKNIIVILMFTLLVASGTANAQAPACKDMECLYNSLAQFKDCKTDADCMLVNVGGCGCIGQWAVEKTHVSMIEKIMEEEAKKPCQSQCGVPLSRITKTRCDTTKSGGTCVAAKCTKFMSDEEIPCPQ